MARYAPPTSEEWLQEKYWDEGLTLVEIAKLVGCDPSCVARRMARYGIEQRPKITSSEAGLRRLARQYQSGATKRGLVWGLSQERLHELAQQDCHYCGDAPSMIIRSKKGKANYIYNGIDRKDSSIGYIEGNVVPCCRTCNWAKGKTGYNEFMDWLDRVATHRGG